MRTGNYTNPLNGQTYNSNFPRYMSLHSWGAFAEDTLKLKTNLTVTLGLRWEYSSAPSEKNNQISNLYARDGSCTPYTCAAPIVGGPWYNPPKDNFAPRIGPNLISTDMSLRKTIVVREGKNITLSADMFNIFNRPNFSPPTSLSVFTSTLVNGNPNPNPSFGTIALNNPYQTITTSRQFQINARFTF